MRGGHQASTDLFTKKGKVTLRTPFSSTFKGEIQKMNNTVYTKTHKTIIKLALCGILTAVAVAGSLLQFPVLGSKCAPVQHMVNIFCAVFLGPWYGVASAFIASLLRNLFSLGSLMAFPCGRRARRPRAVRRIYGRRGRDSRS